MVVIIYSFTIIFFQPIIPLHWDGWIDGLAGIGSYAYEVFKLGNDGSALSEDQGRKVADGHNISYNDISVSYHCIVHWKDNSRFKLWFVL